MKKFFLLAVMVLAAFAASCADKNLCIVNGVLPDDMEGTYAYLCDTEDFSDVIDSVKIDNGRFTFKCPAEIPEELVLRGPMTSNGEDEFFQMIFIEPGVVTADIETGYSSGTPSNEAYAIFMKRQNEGFDRLQAAETLEQRQAIISESEENARAMMEQNGDNLFGVSMLEILNYKMSASEVVQALDAFPEAVRKSRMATRMRAKAESQLATEPGSPYIDIVLPDTEGNALSLSSVVGNPDNKYVLLDFWATWCGPCMGEVPHLKEAYAKYHGKGFEIYGVSLDGSEDAWRSGVKEHGMNWLHVLQPRKGRMEAVEAYGVESIPSNFLIESATGNIIATNLRGEALGAKIAELLD